MPPKNSGASKKNVEKAKQKTVEDKTFGLKNKKGKKQQTYIKNVAKQVTGDNKKQGRSEESNKLSKKEQERKKLEELNELFKPVQQIQKIAFGVDPKSVVCMYFKQGTCQKGNKCKFSHDLSLERKSEKKNLYEDSRSKEGGMDDWDQDTLEDVVNKKHNASNAIKTNIICKYFLEAVDKKQYGWFWACPNGEKCIYRHALPPGYVLNKDKVNEEDEENKVSFIEMIEEKRNALTGNLTPVNYNTFMAWKRRKTEEKKKLLESNMKKKKEDFKSGKGAMKVSGREVFMFKPELADADDDEADETVYRKQDDDDTEATDGQDIKVQDINLDEINASIQKNSVDDSKLTRVTTLSAKDRLMVKTSETTNGGTTTAMSDTASAAQSPTDDVIINGVPVDESLFEDMDDLDLED